MQRAERFPISAGETFGSWTVVGERVNAWKGGKDRAHYPCRCACGREALILASHLRSGWSKGCGCVGKSHPKHGDCGTELYNHWRAMKGRCLYPGHKKYAFYGGRGVRVCGEWMEYAPFRDWAQTHGYEDGLTLDRIDSNGHYCPENCRWATQLEQKRNTRSNVFVTAFGETKCVSEWVSDPRCQVGRGVMNARIGRGWEPEKAIATPPLWRRDDLRKSV